MQNLRISAQLLILIGALIAGFAIATFFQERTAINAIYKERYQMLQMEVDTAISVMNDFYAREQSGELTRDEAQQQAYAMLTKIKYEPDGYFFGYDHDVNMVFHPNSKLVGNNYRGKGDTNGVMYRDELVKAGRAGGGYVEFIGPKPGEDPADYSFPKATYGKEFAPWNVIVVTGLYTDDLKAQIASNVMKTIGLSIGIIVVALLLGMYIVRGITRPLKAIHGSLEAVANDDVDVAIPYTGLNNEVGMMAKATEALQEKVRERHAMAARQEEQQKQLDAERQTNADMQRTDAEQQAHVVSTIGLALEQLAKGDLTIRCAELGTKYAELRRNFNEAIEHLEDAMGKVNSKGIDIGGSKDEIRRASNELSQRTERQAASLEETSAAIDELAVAVRQTAEGAREAAKQVEAASSEALRSDTVVSNAIDAMNGIEQSSTQIANIIGVIEDIAFQTNLLALNAGVEAARAGESGKGFAVVAQEVRELAQRSASAAKEIKDQISNSSGQVDNGVQLVGQAGEALKRISDQIKTANDFVTKIAHSAAEQDTTLRSIASSVNQLDTATQQNAAMAEETTASAEVLANDTEDLLNLIRGFKVSNAQRGGASALHGMAEQMRRAS